MKPPIHPLRRWLFEHQHTLAEFADLVGTSQSYISEWLTGKKTPNAELMGKVATVTKQAIMPNDFVAFKQAFDRQGRKRRAA
jgi:transcriptional regulator with XRE-family HTH domain